MTSDEEKAEAFADSENTKRYAHTIYAALIDGYMAGLTESRKENEALRELLERAKEVIGSSCRCSGISDDDCDECLFRSKYEKLKAGKE